MPRTCPDCEVPLESRNFHSVNIDACPKCAGLFFDDGEVARIKALGLAALTELEDAVTPTVDPDPELHNRHRLCPACHVSMDKFRYMYSSNIILDECPNCGGVWVQDGELRRMREVLESQTTGPKVVRVSSATAVKPNAESFSLRLQRVHQFILGIGKS